MGLSYNANWGSIQLQNSDMGCAAAAAAEFINPELPPSNYNDNHHLFTFHDTFSIHDTCIDPLFDSPPPPPPPPSLYYDDQSLFFNPNNLMSPLPHFFPGQQQDYFLLDSLSSAHFGKQQNYCCPKRQKTSYHHDYLGGIFDVTTTTNTTSNFLLNMNPSSGQMFFPELPLEMLIDVPLPNFPEVYGSGSSHDNAVVHQESTTCNANSTSSNNVGVNGKMKANLSPQSIAARVRRKKISEKTQELGELIPGGHKMNTAEMFQAASKYIKFLQAQLGVLQSMPPSIQENEDGEEFIGLVTSTIVQEKMYMAEKCLVPKKMIESVLANDNHQLQSKPQLLKDINQIINKTG